MGQPHEAGKREPGKMRSPMQHKTYYRTLNEGRRVAGKHLEHTINVR